MNDKKILKFIFVFATILVFSMILISAEQNKRYIISFSQSADKSSISNVKDWILSKGEVKYDWSDDAIKAMTVILPESSLEELRQINGIKDIKEDVLKENVIQLAESVPIVRSNEVWAQSVDGSGTKVCVVDTGVGPNPYINIIAQYDFVHGDSDAFDDNSHGTHCAGTIQSTNSIMKGNAPGASIMVAKTVSASGSGYESDTVAGIYWCAKGSDGTYGTGDEADIISISLGFSEHSTICDEQPAAAAANDVVNHGVFVVAASGNNCYTNAISNPACGSKVVSVGATYDANVGVQLWSCCNNWNTYADKIVCFSNGNQYLDLVAPGSVIISTVPFWSNPSYFDSKSGTSMAAPHVAGIAALLLDEDSSLTPVQIKDILIDTAVDLGYPVYRQGNGRVSAFSAWLAAHGQECSTDNQCSDGNSCTYDICNGNHLCTNTWYECYSLVYDGCCPPSCEWPQDLDCNPCGNGVCDNGETYMSCSQDCPIHDGGYDGTGGYSRWREFVENMENEVGIY